jgi:tight adherence protein B
LPARAIVMERDDTAHDEARRANGESTGDIGCMMGPSLSARPGRGRLSLRVWIRQAGLGHVGPGEFVAAVVAVFVVGVVAGYVLFGAVLPAVVAGVFAASFPVSAYRTRRGNTVAAASEAWPRMLEELRLRTGSLGQSIPQALFEVGRRAPSQWRPAFAAAEREWLLTTDFPRTLSLLKDRLADPGVDVVCETLEVAQVVGGTDLDARLGDLIDDRVIDLQGRKDAASRQAGVRFARRFVLLVPLGMALAGLSIGTGRSAYQTPGGQVAVTVGLLAVVACWVWSGRLMRLPSEPRVFR